MKTNRLTLFTVLIMLLLTSCSSIINEVDKQNNTQEVEQELDDQEIEQEKSTNIPDQTQSLISDDIDLANLFAPFWESWEILHDHFYTQPLDDEIMLSGAKAYHEIIKGI